MQIVSSHAEDDPAPQRARRPPPQAQGAGGGGRDVALRLPARGGPPAGPAPHRGRAAREARGPGARDAVAAPGTRGARGARRAVMVVDASALLEVLLRTPTGERVEQRLFAR